jgi:hypothetical protein
VWYPLVVKENLEKDAAMMEQVHHVELRQAECPYQARQGPGRNNGRAVPDITASDRETENILCPVIAWRHVY